LDHKLKGALIGPSSYFKKSPPVQFTDDEARRLTEEFIQKYRIDEMKSETAPGRTAPAKASVTEDATVSAKSR
jgi:myo-inositol-1-phosphate synthase